MSANDGNDDDVVYVCAYVQTEREHHTNGRVYDYPLGDNVHPNLPIKTPNFKVFLANYFTHAS